MSSISKVIYGDQTLIDLTQDTVTASTLKEGVTAHGADGEPITGTLIDLENINIFLDGMSLTQNDVTGLIANKPVDTMARVYCNNMASINGTAYDNSILEKDVTWVPVTNGFYNAEFNTYIYNNYLPMQRDGSLFAKFQGNTAFNLAIKTSGTVTNMGYMMNGCSGFNNSVQIGNNVTNCRSLLMDCTNFDQSIHIPASVTNARSMLWGCTNFNSPVTFDDAQYNIDLRGLFADTSFNLPITLPEGTRNVGVMFQNALFNQPIVIPNSVDAPEGLAYFLFNATSFNSPITIGNNVTNCYQALDCPSGGGVFNQDIYFPYSVQEYRYALFGQAEFESNIYINNRFANNMNMPYLMAGNTQKRKNIFCYNLASIDGNKASNSVTGTDISWTADSGNPNCMYNTQYNIYLYYNYLGKQGGTTLVGAFSGNTSFNLPIDMEGTVTNCAMMVRGSSNFNSPVTIGENVTNCQNMLALTPFNQPISFPNSVTDMTRTFNLCTEFNSPVTLGNNITTMVGTFRYCNNFNQPLVIPDKVTNCKWLLIGGNSFNSPITIGANVADCSQMLEGYYWDDSTQTEYFEGGTFNQPIIFPKSVALANFALAGQKNMKADICILNSDTSCASLLYNSDYVGNIYTEGMNGNWSNAFWNKTAMSDQINIYTKDDYSMMKLIGVGNLSFYTGINQMWYGDDTNEIIYSLEANIYIHCNWNGVLPEYLQ